MHKNRSTTPCLGICSTTYGDDVCKGCKRVVHEIISWPKYSMEERAFVNDRLEKFKYNALNQAKKFDIKIILPRYENLYRECINYYLSN
jgi:predicted Fe-S protein YdhL (DUF1289 family)